VAELSALAPDRAFNAAAPEAAHRL